ncbi:YrhB domain-containing protein [Sphingomonas sp.]|uniref:YrhB domain-containing protein n=1 Tax=Sphingomonas sp. TaxID=28214 RepID=UPI0025F6C293|nr:YrhB domain-containing protein [Sphingomonas sp.]
MEKEKAAEVFGLFLANKEKQIGQQLSEIASAERVSDGWAFYYQARAYVDTGDFNEMLIGHGPVVVRDDGCLIEGGSLDHHPEALLNR